MLPADLEPIIPRTKQLDWWRIYDRERCICDAVRYSNKMDREILNQAIHAYVQDKHKNITKLLDYAKKLKAYKKIQTWVGVWL